MHNIFCIVLPAILAMPVMLPAQSFVDHLVRLAPSATVPEAVGQASKQGGVASGQEFWLGLQFDLRSDITFRLMHIEDKGGVNIVTSDSHFNRGWWESGPWFNMDYLRTTGITSQPPNWGLFIRYEKSSGRFEPRKILPATLDSIDDSDFDSVVFWATGIPTNASFTYLRDLINSEGRPEAIRRTGVVVLSLYDHPDLIPTLARMLSGSTDKELFKDVALWLAMIPRQESLDVLTGEYGRATDSDRKKHLIFAISQHGSDASAKTLITIAESEKNHESRKDAIFWLGQLAGRKTLQVLSDIAMSDPELEIKKHAVFVISQHGEKEEAAELLIDIAQNHPEPKVRKAAMFWLGQTDSDKALAFFRKVLTE